MRHSQPQIITHSGGFGAGFLSPYPPTHSITGREAFERTRSLEIHVVSYIDAFAPSDSRPQMAYATVGSQVDGQ